MRKLIIATLAVVSLVGGGLIYAGSSYRNVDKTEPTVAESGYTCPITGEELPCPNCCPLNQKR